MLRAYFYTVFRWTMVFALLGGLAGVGPRAPQTALAEAPAAPTALPYPIMFVTQIPHAQGFGSVTTTFGNHYPGMGETGRGGDLYIRYPNGQLRNLTAEAGFGGSGLLTATLGIAVRDPAISWDGTKALFSMVIGAPTKRYEVLTYYWQMYEVTGFQYPTQTVQITKVPNQPANFNNISPIYGTDGRIIFTTDRPRNGQRHLYPQLDEYELAPVVSGLWSLDPATGDLKLLNHAPSGDFTPIIDSFGRVIFTQWDHLQRDQEADMDATFEGANTTCSNRQFGTFNYADESAGAAMLPRMEVFPEPRSCRSDLLTGTNLVGHTFNQFFPWEIHEDGTNGEIINHLGRHELGTYGDRSMNDDPNLVETSQSTGGRLNQNPIYTGMFQVKEDPTRPGVYFGVDAPEFGSHATGYVVSMTAPPHIDADHIPLTYVTNREAAYSGRYRELTPLSDGTLMAVHTDQANLEEGNGFNSTYDLRLKTLKRDANNYYIPDQPLTGGISKTVSYWSPDELLTYSGYFWELNPVEVRPRAKPTKPNFQLGPAEQQAFDQAGVTLAEVQIFMRQRNLGLAVSHNVTRRDDLDRQQPFNLKVFGSNTQTLSPLGGKVYDVAFMQFFQADQLRGYKGEGGTEPRPGRRVLAQFMHDQQATSTNLMVPGQPGSVALGADGSMAAFVPANRAMSWQLTDQNGVGVVRERYWITFQPGEVRVCATCHGLSSLDQAGQPLNGTAQLTAPQAAPQALLDLLKAWKVANGGATVKLYLPMVRR